MESEILIEKKTVKEKWAYTPWYKGTVSPIVFFSKEHMRNF